MATKLEKHGENMRRNTENTIGEIGVNFFESSNIERYISLVKCIKDRNA